MSDKPVDSGTFPFSVDILYDDLKLTVEQLAPYIVAVDKHRLPGHDLPASSREREVFLRTFGTTLLHMSRRFASLAEMILSAEE